MSHPCGSTARVTRSKPSDEQPRSAPSSRPGIVIAVRLELGAVGMDQHDLPAHPARKRPRLLVDRIAELLDRAPNSLPRFRPNIRAIVEHSRNGDARDAGRLGDIVDRRVSPRHARSLASVSTRSQRLSTALASSGSAPLTMAEMEALSFRSPTSCSSSDAC